MPLGAGRIGERAEQVEDRADAQLATHGPGMAHGAVMLHGEQETKAHVADAARHLGRRKVQIDAGGLEHVGAAALAGGGAIAVLGNVGAGRRGHDRRRGGNVEALGAAAAAGAAGVHQVRHVDVDLGRYGPHGGGGTGYLLHRLALGLEANEHGGDLRWRGFAGHDGVEHRSGLGLRQ